jgi:hypothetical protein
LAADGTEALCARSTRPCTLGGGRGGGGCRLVNHKAFVQATWRHAVFGLALAQLADLGGPRHFAVR